MSEVIAYYLANSFYRNTMCLNSISILFFICLILYVIIIKKMKAEIIKLLTLEIINGEPLDFKTIKC